MEQYRGEEDILRETGQVEVAQELIKHGADVNGGVNKPLQFAVCNGKTEMVKLLLNESEQVTKLQRLHFYCTVGTRNVIIQIAVYFWVNEC